MCLLRMDGKSLLHYAFIAALTRESIRKQVRMQNIEEKYRKKNEYSKKYYLLNREKLQEYYKDKYHERKIKNTSS